MAKENGQQSSSFSLPEVPVVLREVPSQFRDARGLPLRLPLRAGRHITRWILWQTSRVSLLEDHSRPQPPGKRFSKTG
ncbi:MAG: hypothetical protein WDZ37_04870 [Solirubrobacterales bacterium]